MGALNIFEQIKNKNNCNGDIGRIHPHVITAMIDAFGRSGYLDKAENIYTNFCNQNNEIFYKFKITMMLSIFSSCNNYGDMERAKRIVSNIEIIQKENNCDGILVHNLRQQINGK